MKKMAVFLLAVVLALVPMSRAKQGVVRAAPLGYPDSPLPTVETWFGGSPAFFAAQFTFYRVDMGATARWRGMKLQPGDLDWITLETCGDIGKAVWVDFLDGKGWVGPYRVADCSGRGDIYFHIHEGGAGGEFTWKTAVSRGWVKDVENWRKTVCEGCWTHLVHVAIGHLPDPTDMPVEFASWWLDRAEYTVAPYKDPAPVFLPPREKYHNSDSDSIAWWWKGQRYFPSDFVNPEPVDVRFEDRLKHLQ